MADKALSATQAAEREKVTSTSRLRQVVIALLACLAVLAFAYHSVLAGLVSAWSDPDFSHGYLVAPFAAYLAWRRRKQLADVELRPSWAGLAVLIGAFLIRRTGLFCGYASLERLSLVVSVWGIVLLVVGWQVTKRMAGPLLFLLLMLPPPGQLVAWVTFPLQLAATKVSAWILSAMGWEVRRTGNVIRLPLQSYGVANACSGLRMVFAIVTIGAVMACLLRRPLWERIVLLVSTVPIALAVNVARVVITGTISEAFHESVDPVVVHDWAGYLMVPVAILTLWWVQRFLRSAAKLPAATG